MDTEAQKLTIPQMIDVARAAVARSPGNGPAGTAPTSPLPYLECDLATDSVRDMGAMGRDEEWEEKFNSERDQQRRGIQ